ncbi:MAG: putative carveol dehydrogenase [Frankiales bacterium]|nr:putative carveol dehydrogenase [Frankiales bacterium]
MLISSTAGLKGFPNFAHYVAAKHGVVGLMRTLAHELAPHLVRVNSVHPTSVDTTMVMNDAAFSLFAPDLASPTREQVGERIGALNLMPVPWIEAIDVSNAVLFLASDEARYITGVALPVDAGTLVK